MHENIFTVGSVLAYFIAAPMYRSRYFSKFGLNLGVHFVGATLAYYFGSSLGHALYEPRFASKDQYLQELANKYQFTIFDFAQAKKEAHLKHLRSELVKEVKLQIRPQ